MYTVRRSLYLVHSELITIEQIELMLTLKVAGVSQEYKFLLDIFISSGEGLLE